MMENTNEILREFENVAFSLYDNHSYALGYYSALISAIVEYLPEKSKKTTLEQIKSHINTMNLRKEHNDPYGLKTENV